MALMKPTSACDSSHYKSWSVKLGLQNKLDPGYIPFLTQIALAKGLKNKLEIDAEVALLFYEDAVSLDSARSIRANRTRPLLRTYGIISGLAKIVFGNHKKKIGGGRLADLDLLQYSLISSLPTISRGLTPWSFQNWRIRSTPIEVSVTGIRNLPVRS